MNFTRPERSKSQTYMKNIFLISLLFALCSCSGRSEKTQTPEKLKQLAVAVEDNLYNNIIPFWLNHSVDSINGGFFGTVDNEGNGDPEAHKALILNARILWTFSGLYMKDKDQRYLLMADRAYQYIDNHFIDKEFGGGFYTVDKAGKCLTDTKNTYANAFLIYGLAEYFRATGNQAALEHAKKTFMTLEKFAHDSIYGGYSESFLRDWSPAPPRKGGFLNNDGKTMNTSLHLMEAFANLHRVWVSPILSERLEEMITLTLEKIINPETHLQYYMFNRDWSNRADIKSYGHDIECSWLLLESAEILGNEVLIERVKKASLAMAQSTLEALNPDGRLVYESVNGKAMKALQWWAQAEAVVGYVNAWQLTGDEVWLDRAQSVWAYTDKTFIDKQFGEWYWGLEEDEQINRETPKISDWKCPYHNSRMCMEVIRRAN